MELYSPVVGRWRACSNATSNIDVKSSSFWESAEIKEYTMKQRANGLHHFSNYFKPIVSPLLSIPSLFDDFSISINTHTGTYQRILLNQYKGRYLKVWLKLINSRDHSPLSESLLSLRGGAALLILSIVICMLA